MNHDSTHSAEPIFYLDMWIGERIQEMKLAGIRRFAAMRNWNVVARSERSSRPATSCAPQTGTLPAHRPILAND